MNDVTFEKLYNKRLKDNNIIVVEKYKKENPESKKATYLYRYSDERVDDPIVNANKIEKSYFCNNNLIFKDKKFNKDILYTFISETEKGEVNCPNCGAKGKSSDFINGCPYCKTSFYIDYAKKEYGNANQKKYLSDYIGDDPGKIYLLVTIILTLIVYISQTYKTHFLFAFADNLLINLTLSIGIFMVCAYFMYIFSALLLGILTLMFLPIILFQIDKKIKYNNAWEKINKKNVVANKSDFFNSVNQELYQYYFSNEKYKNLIDFNIIKYNNLRYRYENNILYIKIYFKVSKIYIINNKIKRTKENVIYDFKYNQLIEQNDRGKKVAKCSSCGAPLDLTKRNCEYCGASHVTRRMWEINEIIKD